MKILCVCVCVCVCVLIAGCEVPCVSIDVHDSDKGRLKFQHLATEIFQTDRYMQPASVYIMTVDDTVSFIVYANNKGVTMQRYPSAAE